MGNAKDKYSMKRIIEQIIDRNTEGNYLLSNSDKAQMVSEILDLFGVMKCEGCFKEIQNTDCYCEDCYIKHGELQ